MRLIPIEVIEFQGCAPDPNCPHCKGTGATHVCADFPQGLHCICAAGESVSRPGTAADAIEVFVQG